MDSILESIVEQKWDELLALDELIREMGGGRVCVGFKALEPEFAPTFKRIRRRGLLPPPVVVQELHSKTERKLSVDASVCSESGAANFNADTSRSNLSRDFEAEYAQLAAQPDIGLMKTELKSSWLNQTNNTSGAIVKKTVGFTDVVLDQQTGNGQADSRCEFESTKLFLILLVIIISIANSREDGIVSLMNGVENISDFYNTVRLPSYTDRVLYRSLPMFETHLKVDSFTSVEAALSSDHKPVQARFRLTLTPDPIKAIRVRPGRESAYVLQFNKLKVLFVSIIVFSIFI